MKRVSLLALIALTAGCGSRSEPASKAAAPPASATPVAQGKYAPRDECGKLPGAADFRQKLVEAVQVRDANAFVALADPAIKLDFGGGGGPDQLKRQLGTDPKLWVSLEHLMRLGCADDGRGNLVLPWLFAQDLGAIDATSALLVTGENVPVLAAPRASATPVTTISWNFVSAANGLDPAAPYQHVTLPLKADGYVASGKLRSVLDYRLLASRTGNQWHITALVKGD